MYNIVWYECIKSAISVFGRGVNVGRLDALFDQLILYGLLKKSYLHLGFFSETSLCNFDCN